LNPEGQLSYDSRASDDYSSDLQMNKLLKLNLGCGHFILPGWVNVDVASLPGVDVVHDLNKLPLPFENESVDEILCDDVLEHLDYPPILKDCHRILIAGGKLRVHVPHFTSSNNAVDPTHKHQFSIKTLNFFCSETFEGKRRSYYNDFAFSRITHRRILFSTAGVFAFNRPIEALVNASYRLQIFYEATGWSRLFPAQDLEIVLVK
jgi:SAM-dependent methyltransferase